MGYAPEEDPIVNAYAYMPSHADIHAASLRSVGGHNRSLAPLPAAYASVAAGASVAREQPQQQYSLKAAIQVCVDCPHGYTLSQ